MRQRLGTGDAGLLARATALGGADLVEHGLHLVVEVAAGGLGLFLGQVAAADEVLGVGGAHALLGVDDVVHRRLGHRRVVGLVVAALAVADEVDDDVLAVAVAVLDGQLADPHDGLRVVAVDVEDRAAVGLGQVGGVVRRTRGVGGGGEADLVVHHDVDGAADLVAAQGHEVQGLLDDAQAREGRVAVEQHRHDRVALVAAVDDVLLRARQAHDDRVDGLEVGRVGGQGDVDLAVAEHLDVTALGAQVVLHVTGAAGLRRVHVALELGEDLRQGLADDVGQHVEAATVRHADDDLVEALTGRGVDGGVHQRDQRLGTLEGEALLADVLGLQEVLERLGGVELLQDVLLLGVRRAGLAALDAVLQPLALVGVEDVGVLGADLEAVGVAEADEHLAQGHALLAAEAADVERAVVVPQRQAVGGDVEVAVVGGDDVRVVEVQRVDVREQVAALAVGLDEAHDAGVLVDADVGDVLRPADRGVGHAHVLEDLVPELVVDEQLRHGAQELAGLRTLDDAVVVGRGDGHQLADAQLGETVGGGAGELGGVIHGADADDGALALGQAGHGVASADAARVGQRNGDAGEVLAGQLAVAGADDDVLVGVDELLERQRLAFADGRDDEGAGAVLVLHVDGQAQVDVLRHDERRLAVDDVVGVVHVRVGHDGLDHRVADDVGEGDLAAAGALELVVDQGAVFEHEARGHVADRRGRRDLQRDVHVLGDGLADAAQGGLAGLGGLGGRGDVHGGLLRLERGGLLRGAGRLRALRRAAAGFLGLGFGGGCGLGHRRRILRVVARGRGTDAAGGRQVRAGGVLGEVIAPFRVDGIGILLELLEHLVDQPLVLAEAHVAAHGRYSPHFMLIASAR